MLISWFLGVFLNTVPGAFEFDPDKDCKSQDCSKLSKTLDDGSTMEATEVEISKDEKMIVSFLWSDGGWKLPLESSVYFGSESINVTLSTLLCPLMLGMEWKARSEAPSQITGPNNFNLSLADDIKASPESFSGTEQYLLKRNLAVVLSGIVKKMVGKEERSVAFLEKISRSTQVLKAVYCVRK